MDQMVADALLEISLGWLTYMYAFAGETGCSYMAIHFLPPKNRSIIIQGWE